MKDWSDILKTLESFPKVELEDIRRFFGAKMPSHVRKGELASRLCAFIIDKPSEWLGHMLERDLRLLKKLVDAGPEVPIYLDFPDYPSVLETVRLIGSDVSDGNFRMMWIPKQFYDVVAPHIDEAIREGEENGMFEMERAALGYLQLYGVVTMDEFFDRMLDYWEYSCRHSIEAFVSILHDSPVMKLCRCDVDGDRYLSAPNVFDHLSILQSRKSYPSVKGYKKFTPEEAIKAGTGSPLFVYGLDTKEGKALVRMLSDLGYSGEDLLREEHDIWVNSQMASKDDTTEALFMGVIRKQDDIESFDDYDTSMGIVASYANSLPKWLLCGHSSNEMNCLKVMLQSEEDPMEALIRKNPLMGLFVPPAPADAPCPCGSGFTYRNCHGKYRN